MAESNKAESKKKLVTRREFLVGSGAVIAAGALVACTPGTTTVTQTQTKTATTTLPGTTATTTVASTTTLPPTTKTVTSTTTTTQPVSPSYPASKGYLVYDSKKCAGCTSCMGACSLVHEGKVNLSLARIQIAQDSFGRFPYDIKMSVCRQCVTPVCVQMCPTGAAHIDTANGNVRVIDQDVCIGCGTCLAACPQQPNRTVWNPEIKKSSKCDLCLDTPYWSEQGGPSGKQACVEVCPMKALKMVNTTPDQTETDGYDVNLRTENWAVMGLVENNITYYITPSTGPGGRISGTTTVLPGFDAVLTIAPNSGYAVKDVVVDGKSVGAVTTYTFSKVDANHTMAATFVEAK